MQNLKKKYYKANKVILVGGNEVLMDTLFISCLYFAYIFFLALIFYCYVQCHLLQNLF